MSLMESLFEDGAESLFKGGIETILSRAIPKMKGLDYDYQDAKKPWLNFVKEVLDSGQPAIFIADSRTWNSLGVRVKSSNWTIIMDLEKRKLNGRRYFHTLIRVPYKMTDKFRFDIAYKGRFESQYIGLGWNKVKTADNKFNLNYFLRSNNQSKLKTLISDPIFQSFIVPGFVELLKDRSRHPPYFCFRTTQRCFLESQILFGPSKHLQKNDYPSLKGGIGELEFMVNRVIKDVDQLKLYFGFIEGCLKCLTSMGCASPEPVNFSRALPKIPDLIYPAESVELISELSCLGSRFGNNNETIVVPNNQFNTLMSKL